MNQTIWYPVKYIWTVLNNCPASNHHTKPSGPRLNIRKDVFPLDLVKYRSHEISTLNCRIALQFDRHIGSTVAEVLVKFQSDGTNLNTNLATSRLYEILRKDVFSDIETGPCIYALYAMWRSTQSLGTNPNVIKSLLKTDVNIWYLNYTPQCILYSNLLHKYILALNKIPQLLIVYLLPDG